LRLRREMTVSTGSMRPEMPEDRSTHRRHLMVLALVLLALAVIGVLVVAYWLDQVMTF
jgi:hypothetical protein